MCEEPRTEGEAAEAYWFKVGIRQMGALVEYMQTQKTLVEDAFIAGALWGIGRERLWHAEREAKREQSTPLQEVPTPAPSAIDRADGPSC